MAHVIATPRVSPFYSNDHSAGQIKPQIQNKNRIHSVPVFQLVDSQFAVKMSLLISKYSTKLIVYVVNYSYSLGCIPFKISEKLVLGKSHLVVIRNKTWRRKLFTFFGILTHFIYFFHIIAQAYIVIHKARVNNYPPKIQLAITVKMLYYTLGYTIALFYMLHHWLYQDQLLKLLQCYLSFYRRTETHWKKTLGRLQNQNRPAQKLVEHTKTITFYIVVLFLITVQNTRLFFKKPKEVNFLTSWMDNPGETVPGFFKMLVLMEYLHHLLSLWVSNSYSSSSKVDLYEN